MKTIRKSVFETNSSSTHSISIYKWTPTKESHIPKNTKIKVNGKIPTQIEIKDEMGKLNYIIAILASIEDHRNWKNEHDFDIVINSNHFIWLKELVKDKCNTEIIYEKTSNYHPYFETTSDDSRSIEDVLDCDIDNEKEFKERVTEIIFDENYIIEDKENKY